MNIVILSGRVATDIDSRVTKDGNPMDEKSVCVSADAKNGQSTFGGWYGYHYRIPAAMFQKDGLYKLELSSKDTADHTSDTSEQRIEFLVDHTPPQMVSVKGLEKGTIDKETADVEVCVTDVGGLDSVKIFVDQKEVLLPKITDPNRYQTVFTLSSGPRRHHIRIVATDRAGNITDTDAKTYRPAFAFHPHVMVSQNRALQVVGELLMCFRR